MKIRAVLLVLLVSGLGGCEKKYLYHPPSISYENFSDEKLYDIRGNWNGYKMLPTTLLPGQGAGQTFPLTINPRDIYGPFHVSWKNSKKERFEKTFLITEKDFPPYNKDWPKYLQFELTQSDVTYYTNATPNASEYSRERAKILRQLRIDYRQQEREAEKKKQ